MIAWDERFLGPTRGRIIARECCERVQSEPPRCVFEMELLYG